MSQSCVARPARILILIGAAVMVATLLYLLPPGQAKLSLRDILHEIGRGPVDITDPNNNIVWWQRLPRVALCLLVGGLLGAVGSAFQALLRNPLADPFVLGVSGGAAVGGAVGIALGAAAGGLLVTGLGFVGGMLALALVYALASRRGAVDADRLILAGSVAGSLLSSVLIVVLLAAGQDTNVILRWLLGDTSHADWRMDGLLLGALLLGFPLLVVQSRKLNALALGGDAARRLGVDPVALTRLVLLAGGFMTAATVGTVGIVGFLGLIAPHLARRLLGVDWRWSLPGSLLIGSLLLVVADLVAQRALPTLMNRTGLELPVGAVTSILGAPTLLALLRKRT